jgi:hypothetical protein
VSVSGAPDGGGGVGVGRLAWVAGTVSLGVIAFEVSLMRLLLVASWHHLAFLVISVALLGFGASGAALCLARSWLTRRPRGSLAALALLCAVSMPVCVSAAGLIPIESQLLPAMLWRQVGAWVGAWALLAVPFFLAGTTVGLAISLARARVGLVYGANLIGSAGGAALIAPVMGVVEPAWLPAVSGALAAPAVLGVTHAGRGLAMLVAGGAVVVALSWSGPTGLRMDQYKYGAYVERLARAGEAEREVVALGSRGRVEVWAGEVFHEVPFLSLDAAPPPVGAVMIDGHWAGAVLRIGSPAGAAPLRRSLAAAPYGVAPEAPRVALLGEVGGAGAWLAAAEGASSIRWVQPHARAIEAIGSLSVGAGGAVMSLEGLEITRESPRHFVDHTRERFDLVMVSALERATAGAGGIGGLAEDHLVTTGGMASAIGVLGDDGVLAVCRAIQSPPRDNLKLVATLAEALRAGGVERPGDHVVVVRDFLGVCTMVRPRAWSDEDLEEVRRLCRSRALTPVWFRGVRGEELNRPDTLPGPEDEPGDWLHHGARRLLGNEARSFVDGWVFDIRPPTDARPFFLDFCRLSSIGALREAFGPLWLTRAELAFLFVLATAGLIALVGALVTLAPLAALRSAGSVVSRPRVVVYFGAIGLGYLGLEMVALSLMIRLVGDPVLAASATIAGFLFFSGLGSVASRRAAGILGARWPWMVAAVAVVAVADLWAFSWVAGAAGGLPIVPRVAAGLAALSPMALVMGTPMPMGLARVDAGGPALVPWAWGINGFASVLSAPVALALAMAFGYHVSAAVAVSMYALAALAGAGLDRGALALSPGGDTRGGEGSRVSSRP